MCSPTVERKLQSSWDLELLQVEVTVPANLQRSWAVQCSPRYSWKLGKITLPHATQESERRYLHLCLYPEVNGVYSLPSLCSDCSVVFCVIMLTDEPTDKQTNRHWFRHENCPPSTNRPHCWLFTSQPQRHKKQTHFYWRFVRIQNASATW